MDAADRQALIERYRALPDAIAPLLADAPDAALDAAAGPGEWPARQIVHHLGDSELMDAARLRLIAAEEQPQITPYDETLFAQRLGAERPIGPSLAAIRAARESGRKSCNSSKRAISSAPATTPSTTNTLWRSGWKKP